MTKKQPADTGGGGEKQQRRSRSRQPGSIQAYDTDMGKRWRFQIYVLKDPEYPEIGSRRLTRSGFTSTDEANDALQEALKQRKQNEKFANKVHTVGTEPYWVSFRSVFERIGICHRSTRKRSRIVPCAWCWTGSRPTRTA